ncbi:MAG: coenzyme F420-0:L-glutamate ligase [Nitrospinota bacterium]
MRVEIVGLSGLPLIGPGDDLGGLLAAALERQGAQLRDEDILVVAQKVVSKAEGRMVDLREVAPSPEAQAIALRDGRDPRLVEVVLRESNEVVRAAPVALIVEHRLGCVCAHGGVDRSNVAGSDEIALLLPLDPDASARRLRERLREIAGAAPAVLISDSQGRAFRRGVVGVALGCAGLEPLVDRRGELDLFGRSLQITQVGTADQVASAASLVMGEGDEAIPAVLIRGLPYRRSERPARVLLRPKAEDLFR